MQSVLLFFFKGGPFSHVTRDGSSRRPTETVASGSSRVHYVYLLAPTVPPSSIPWIGNGRQEQGGRGNAEGRRTLEWTEQRLADKGGRQAQPQPFLPTHSLHSSDSYCDCSCSKMNGGAVCKVQRLEVKSWWLCHHVIANCFHQQLWSMYCRGMWKDPICKHSAFRAQRSWLWQWAISLLCCHGAHPNTGQITLRVAPGVSAWHTASGIRRSWIKPACKPPPEVTQPRDRRIPASRIAPYTHEKWEHSEEH